MLNKAAHITVYEHQSIKLNQIINGVKFDVTKLNAMQSHFGQNGVPYFTLIHNGVCFNEFVGVIQVGQLLIEVLPKTDKNPLIKEEENRWRNLLIGMLRAVSSFDIKSTSYSNLKVKPNTILDLYFELFIKEVEYIFRNGLIKRYRKLEGNSTALKGKLLFDKHIQKNLIHNERFYVHHTTYDTEHTFHKIIYKTICLLKQINTNQALQSRIGSLLLDFPEMPFISVTENTFNKLVFNRKTLHYKKVLEIAKMILLNFHPDISHGSNYVLALMFDMNKLWEQFVNVSLHKHRSSNTTISPQTSKYFWKPEKGYRSKIRPDIVLNKGQGNCIVLDTKWKNLNGNNPSPDDLRQMYVYHEYFNARKTALVYPGITTKTFGGFYLAPGTSQELDKECSIITLKIESDIKEWQKSICSFIDNWIN